jgi:hypothetical protein
MIHHQSAAARAHQSCAGPQKCTKNKDLAWSAPSLVSQFFKCSVEIMDNA